MMRKPLFRKRRRKWWKPLDAFFLLFVFLLAACAPSATETAQSQSPSVPTATLTEIAPPTPTMPPATPTPSRPSSGLEANPQRVTFQAEDDTELVGYYYPSRYADAPVVVYAHWVMGDQRDWSELALWLQNRENEVTEYPHVENRAPWHDLSWFPEIPEDVSFAVFTFDYRGFGESAGDFAPALGLQDSLAAYETAASLSGVDATKMIGIGASIGADGVVDGCLLYNQAHGSGCVGAIALSPGSYLTMSFERAVNDLESLDDPVAVWCLAADADDESYPDCQSASGDLYRFIAYEDMGYLHGMMFILPELEPPALELIVDFLGERLDISELKNR